MAVQITSLDAKVGTLNAIREQRGITAAAETALLNPNAERIQLNTNAGRGPMAAELVVVPSGTSFLLDSSMRTLPSSKTYQLWATTDGRQISLGLLGADPVTVPFLASAPTASTVYAVTVEPKGGSVTPTQAPVAVSV
jgi:anti-sigma-K factor RskA